MPIPNSLYRHYKGGLYRVHSSALREEDLVEMAVYESLQASKDFPAGTQFTRPTSEFDALVPHDGQMIPRFSRWTPSLPETLSFDKPIVFFDLETTGLDILNDRIVEIAIIKIQPDGTETTYEWLINPGMPIPPAVSAVHGITDEMVADAPRFSEIASEIAKIFTDVYIGGYNVKNYDIPLLLQECQRIELELSITLDHIIDPMCIYRQKSPRTLGDAHQTYCGTQMEQAHEAMADIRATVSVLAHQLSVHNDLPKDASALANYCYPPDPDAFDLEGKLRYIDGKLCINFGKNKGRSLGWLSHNERGYLQWILDGNFSLQVKKAIEEVL